jgi:hypothetical protein
VWLPTFSGWGHDKNCAELYDITEHNGNMRFCGSCGGDEFLFGGAERSEGAFWLGLTPPVVDTGEVDVLPDLRGDVANDVIRQVVP